MNGLRRHLAALACFAFAFACVPLFFANRAEAQTTRTRAIILSFEGWNAEQARAAIEAGLNAAYDMISEQQAVDTAMQIGVDPGTPEGLGAVVARLHIQLVIGGSVSGRGARATTTIWVTDTQGNQLATRTAGSPSGRGFEGELTTAALQACGEAVAQLPPPSHGGGSTTTTTGGGGGTTDTTGGGGGTTDTTGGGGGTTDTTGGGGTTTHEEPDYDPSFDIENEVAGAPRGQHGASGSRRGSGGDQGGDGGGDPNRWNQPLFRGMIGVDIRNMSASTAGGPGGNPTFYDHYDQPFTAVIDAWLETRPFAQSDGAERGLYAYVNAEFSAGLSYYRVNDPESEPARDLYLYGLDLGVGYAGTIAETFELIGTVGAGVDGLGFADPHYDPPNGTCLANPNGPGCGGTRDFPSIQAWYVRPDVQGRLRLAGDLLILEAEFAGRIMVTYGDLSNTDFGSASGGGIDWSLGLAGIIDPGFSWRARFGYTANYVTFGEPSETIPGDNCSGWCRDSGLMEAWRITLGIGWAFR
jgi:hypothetical protein